MSNASKNKTADVEMPAVAQDEETLAEMAPLPEEDHSDKDPLDILLAAQQERVTEEIVIPKRPGLVADLRLTIGSLTDRQFRDISTEAEEVVRASNRRDRRAGTAGREVNPDKFLRLIVAGGVVNPDFGNPRLLAKHQVRTAEEVIQNVLLAGEVAKIAELIMDLSGFNDNTVEFAKN